MNDAPTTLTHAAEAGLLVTAWPPVDRPAAGLASGPYEGFWELPVYRCYLTGASDSAFDTPIGAALYLVREPDNRRDRRAVASHASNGARLGYLPREDAVLLGKLIRRGLPVTCRLIGVNAHEAPKHRYAVEVSLLYPPHASTDEVLANAERDRRQGLARVRDKPASARYLSGDPLSAGHVDAAYFRE